MVTGTHYSSMQFNLKASTSAISEHVIDVCLTIWQEYFEECLKFPDKQRLQQIIDGFKRWWNMTNCIGALDGKHIRIIKLHKGASLYWNYKKYHFVILMALVHYKYKFIWVDVGYNGGCSDSQIWNQCVLHSKVDRGDMDLPDEVPLPENIDEHHTSW